MRRFSAVFALVTGITMGASFSTTTIAGALYQWTGKDGTPTYSPDPPPAGVNYEMVGADLKPLPKNIDVTKPVQNPAATPATIVPKTPVASTLPQPAVPPVQASVLAPQARKKPPVPWKPVRYANDPSPAAKIQLKASARNDTDPVTVARNSPACALARQQMVLLEGQFAQALTDQQMDQAILQLREHKPTVQSACKINRW